MLQLHAASGLRRPGSAACLSTGRSRGDFRAARQARSRVSRAVATDAFRPAFRRRPAPAACAPDIRRMEQASYALPVSDPLFENGGGLAPHRLRSSARDASAARGCASASSPPAAGWSSRAAFADQSPARRARQGPGASPPAARPARLRQARARATRSGRASPAAGRARPPAPPRPSMASALTNAAELPHQRLGDRDRRNRLKLLAAVDEIDRRNLDDVAAILAQAGRRGDQLLDLRRPACRSAPASPCRRASRRGPAD